MAREYWFAFSPLPSDTAGLSPTFIVFGSSSATFAPPGLTQRFSGLYYTSYNATQTVAFVLDGATTGLAASQRYIAGVFDNQDQFGQTLSAMAATLAATASGTTLNALGASLSAMGVSLSALGTSLPAGFAANATLIGNQGLTLIAIGNTQTAQGGLFGDTTSSFGSTSVDPTTMFGFLKRSQEYAEGNRTYTKATGLLDYYSRGSSTLLIEKTITDNTAGTTCI